MKVPRSLWLASVGADDEVILSGSPASFQCFASRLRTTRQSRVFSSSSLIPPGGRALNRIQVELDDETEALSLRVEGSALVIHTDQVGLRWLANVIDAFGSREIAGGANHLHLEYYPSHPHLSSDSVPSILEFSEGPSDAPDGVELDVCSD